MKMWELFVTMNSNNIREARFSSAEVCLRTLIYELGLCRTSSNLTSRLVRPIFERQCMASPMQLSSPLRPRRSSAVMVPGRKQYFQPRIPTQAECKKTTSEQVKNYV